jgi:hypothetical protein
LGKIYFLKSKNDTLCVLPDVNGQGKWHKATWCLAKPSEDLCLFCTTQLLARTLCLRAVCVRPSRPFSWACAITGGWWSLPSKPTRYEVRTTGHWSRDVHVLSHSSLRGPSSYSRHHKRKLSRYFCASRFLNF